MPNHRHRPVRPSNDRAALLTPGRHEMGQNWLIDRRFPAAMADILRHAPPLPIVELGAGNGALTRALLTVGTPVTAVELDPGCLTKLRRQFAGRVAVVAADMLGFDYGPHAHHVVSNVPFAITTPVLRRLMPQEHWQSAVLLLQWEVARKRAAVGGTTLLTASWWPWYEFNLAQRVPAAAFAPMPATDGGILVMTRRPRPLVPVTKQVGYQRFVRDVFTGRGHGLAEILRGHLPQPALRLWLAGAGLDGRRLPRDLTAANWASLHAAAVRARPDGPTRPR
ncbi:MAG: 23S ribosomal RNA methyltransferase Erm [Mycobacteriales bacterium]